MTASTPTLDPEGYLAHRKFSRKLPKCPRTGLSVSYSDIGDADGTPLLWLMPSGCSRWFAASQDPLARRYGVRLIAIDRPGVGATPNVPLKDRIRLSCEMMVSVLEHLEVKLAHILATSAGIYYALHLLAFHQDIFLTGLNPPPRVYLIAPWSPLLPATHPDYYPSHFTWIPDKLIETQHVTMPHLMNVARNAADAWSTSSKLFNTGISAAKDFLWGTAPSAVAVDDREGSSSQVQKGAAPRTMGIHANQEGMVAAIEEEPVPQAGRTPGEAVAGHEESQGEGEEEEDQYRGKLWGRFPCCIGCTTTEYFQAENYEGLGQEHLQCLNRGPTNTGHEWLEAAVVQLADALRAAQRAKGTEETPPELVPHPLNPQLWWGWQDGMVPRKGQLWFNKVVSAYPDAIAVEIHDVPDGDHTDLLGRIDGIHQVYGMIWQQGQSTGKPESKARV